jgi:competence protein ComEA
MQDRKIELLKAYFVFSKRERRALVVLCIMTLILIYVFKFNSDWMTGYDISSDEVLLAQKKFVAKNEDSINVIEEKYLFQSEQYNHVKKFTDPNKQGMLFVFNPNTADKSDWEKLGVKASVIQTILKYKAKGGVFKKPEDLRRIFGLSPLLCEKLIPFVKIPEQKNKVPEKESDKHKYEKKEVLVNINHANIEEWKMLEGIGPGYAKRIFNFREKLGGFYSIEQVGETYGLPDSVFRKIKSKLVITSGPYKLIQLSVADEETLRKHPYIDYSTAQNIISYCKQHGIPESVSDLRNIASLHPKVLEKIAPYFSVK